MARWVLSVADISPVGESLGRLSGSWESPQTYPNQLPIVQMKELQVVKERVPFPRPPVNGRAGARSFLTFNPPVGVVPG